MAATITPISIAAPAELVAARPAKTVSSAAIKKDGFQSELNSAVEKKHVNNQQAETSKKQQSSHVRADKTDLNEPKERSNRAAVENKSNSSLSARDTNEASAQQRKELKEASQSTENLTKENQTVADGSVDKDVQHTSDTGNNLPLNGETLPQSAVNSQEVVTTEQLVEPPFDKTALDQEISKLHNQVISSQPESVLAAQVVAVLQAETPVSDNTKAAAVGEAIAPQNKQSLAAEALGQVNVKGNLPIGAPDKLATSEFPVSNTQESINSINKAVVNTNVESIASTKGVVGAESLTKNNSVISPVTRIEESAQSVIKDAGIAQSPVKPIAQEEAGRTLDPVKPVAATKVEVADTVKGLNQQRNPDTVAQVSTTPENTQINAKSTVVESEVASRLSTSPGTVDNQVNTTPISQTQTAKIGSQDTVSVNDSKILESLNTDKPSLNNNQINIKEQPKSEVINTAQVAVDKVASEVQNVIPVASHSTKTELEPKLSQLQAIAASIDSKATGNRETGPGANSASSQSSVVDFVSQTQASANSNLNQPSLSAQGTMPSSVAVVNEQSPSASLNQTLDKLRAGIDVTDSKGVQEGSDSKPTSVKVSANVESLQQLSSFQSSLRSASPVQMQMPAGTPPGAKNWGRAVADKVYIAASQNLRVANIQLDPPELGALQIRLQVTGPDQQMSVAFSSPHASVRDALEQQIPRLKEMLAEQGINLGESSVNDQGGDNKQGTAESGGNRGGNYAEGSDLDNPVNPLNTQGTLSLVDFYA